MVDCSLFPTDVLFLVPPIRRKVHFFLFHVEESFYVFIVFEGFVVFFVITYPECFGGFINHDDVVAQDQQVFILSIR